MYLKKILDINPNSSRNINKTIIKEIEDMIMMISFIFKVFLIYIFLDIIKEKLLIKDNIEMRIHKLLLILIKNKENKNL